MQTRLKNCADLAVIAGFMTPTADMKFPYLPVVVGLVGVACGGVDTGVSSDPSLGSISPAPPSLDAGAAVGSVPPAPGGAPVSPGSVTPSAPATPSDTGGVCEVKSVDSGRVTPDMLIVLDRSGSMRSNGVNRWDPSVMALKSITSSLGGTINFGLLAFPGTPVAGPAPAPTPTNDCSQIQDILERLACEALNIGSGSGIPNVDTCVAGSLEVPIAPNNGMAISAALDRMAPNGATPTAVSLKAAHTAIGSGLAAIDDSPRAKYALLVTDGAPNCSSPNSTGGRGFDNQAVEQSVAEIAAMAKDGIKTYVIGYNTRSDQQLSAALDRMAQAGNTGDKQHRAIEDGNALLTEFQKIAGAIASCELALNSAPPNASFVEVKLDGNRINLNDPNGWIISADRRRITLQGSACAAVASMERHLVSVSVLCEPVVLK